MPKGDYSSVRSWMASQGMDWGEDLEPEDLNNWLQSTTRATEKAEEYIRETEGKATTPKQKRSALGFAGYLRKFEVPEGEVQRKIEETNERFMSETIGRINSSSSTENLRATESSYNEVKRIFQPETVTELDNAFRSRYRELERPVPVVTTKKLLREIRQKPLEELRKIEIPTTLPEADIEKLEREKAEEIAREEETLRAQEERQKELYEERLESKARELMFLRDGRVITRRDRVSAKDIIGSFAKWKEAEILKREIFY